MSDPVSSPPGPVPSRTSGLAIASLVTGILGIGLPAIITGHMARGRIKRTPGLEGAGLALAGLILGYITTILGAIAILLGIAIVLSGGITETAREQAAEAKMMEINANLESYRLISGSYPTTAQGLKALAEHPTTAPVPRRWKQHFVELPIDPWDAEFIYVFDSVTGTITLTSKGADGIAGTADDL